MTNINLLFIHYGCKLQLAGEQLNSTAPRCAVSCDKYKCSRVKFVFLSRKRVCSFKNPALVHWPTLRLQLLYANFISMISLSLQASVLASLY